MVQEPPTKTDLLELVDELHGPQTPKLTVRQRQGKLFKQLDLFGLESWPPELVDSAQLLLAEYQDVFSLEPKELGCTHSTEHMIKVTLMIPLLRNDLDKFPHPWWNRFVTICEKCWIQVPYVPARMHGVMQLCWLGRKMGACTSV